MTKIMPLHQPIRRGQIIGVQTGGPPMTEVTRFWKCPACGGYFDILDLGSVLDHEDELPHPAGDGVQ